MKESLKAIVCAFVKSRWARLRRIVLILGLAFLILWGGADAAIRMASSGRAYSKATVDAVLPARAAVVLGCSRTVRGGLRNLYYQRRIRAAADLYAAGKVRAVVVSGDNHVRSYDEPTDMKGDLVACGVPADRIVCDYAGFRTLDVVIRRQPKFLGPLEKVPE